MTTNNKDIASSKSKPKNVRKVMSKKNRLYVNNKEFLDEMIKSKEQDKLTNEAIEMIQKIAERAINNLGYKYEEDREDGIATAVYKCLLYWRAFNAEKSNNPFSYFTQACKNAYVESFNKLRPLKSSNVISLSNEQINLF